MGAEQALAQAREEALRLGHDSIGAEHILLALLRPGGSAEPLLRRIGLQPEEVRGRLEAGGRRGRPRRGGEEPAHTSHAKRLIEVASKEAREAGSELTSEHLLLAALHEPRGAMARILSDAGISPARVRAEIDAAPAGAAGP
ncbi:MAG: Clp protease N-terminal domain-containing protein, partial [Gemmatimonadales bacterium]